MGAIFLSYAREDRGCAEALARVLESAGHQVWWDRRIETGSEFSAEIEAALDAADVVLVLWSEHSVKSRWVRDEASIGGDTGRLVPVLIDVSQPPIGFRQFHAFDLTGWKGSKRDSRTAELLAAIDRRIARNDGTAPTPALARPPRTSLAGGRRLWTVAIAVLVIAAGAIFIFLSNRDKASGPVKPTIALLPFSTASSDPELRQIASQTRDAVAHTFSKSGLPLRLLDAVPQDGRPSADFLIAGDFSRKGDKVLASIRLDEAAERVTVFSDRFEADREDMRDLPERIGAQMAGNLTWTWPLSVLDKRYPIEPALMAELLQGADFTLGLDNLQGYQNAKRVAAKAPNLASAQIDMAFDTAFVLDQLPRAERGEAVAEARRASERANALRPDVGDSFGAWCLLHSEARKAECEDQLRRGRRIDPDGPFLNTFLSHLLRAVGRFEEAAELARMAHAHDVYVPTKIAWMLKTLEYADERDAARELYQQGVRWWPEFKPMFFRNRLFGLIDRGDFEAMARLEDEIGAKDLPAGYASSRALAAAVKANSVPGAKRTCPQTDAVLLSLRCMIAFAILGDQDSAYAIADKLYPRRVGRTPAETERIWLDDPAGIAPLEFITSPASAPMRRDPRYLQLAQRVGLLDYWRSGRSPDFCRKQPEPICAQLLKKR